MNILETERLFLRHLSTNDAPFILELLNEPAFLQNIGDKGVRTLADAREYLLTGPVASYERFGFGLYLVQLKDAHTALGMCGLRRRETLADVDIGFAFRSQFWGHGYAVEAAAAVKDYARDVLRLKRIVAITLPHNHSSIRVLEKIGLRFEQRIQLSEDAEELNLFGCDF